MAVVSRDAVDGLYARQNTGTASQPHMVTDCAGDYQDGVITPEAYVRFAVGWVTAGASIVGGCCGVGPEHILELKRQFPGQLCTA